MLVDARNSGGVPCTNSGPACDGIVGVEDLAGNPFPSVSYFGYVGFYEGSVNCVKYFRNGGNGQINTINCGEKAPVACYVDCSEEGNFVYYFLLMQLCGFPPLFSLPADKVLKFTRDYSLLSTIVN